MRGEIILKSLIIFILGKLFLVPVSAAKYIHELQHFEAYSDIENFLVVGKLIRIKRGVLGLSVNITVKHDMGNEYIAEVNLYRSALNNDQYVKTPIGAARGAITLQDLFDQYYKRFLMLSVKNCSNLPQFEESFELPLKAQLYQLINCVCNDDDVPEYIQTGTYKLEIILTLGKKKSGIIIVAKRSKDF